MQEQIRRLSQYKFKYSDERYTITGISCLPVNKEMQSPEAEVVEGGLNHSCVAIHLAPQKEYEYACYIFITGKERQPHRTAEVAISTFTFPFILTCCTRYCYF
jgi:hypothetical protein